MIIGMPKETKTDERRAALVPEQVKELIDAGHAVLFESGLSKYLKWSDEDYANSGATSAEKETIFEKADMILKVKSPSEDEIGLLREDQILFAYLHFDENLAPEIIKAIGDTGVSALAYEWVYQHDDYPLLAPMSNISGVIFAKRTMELLTNNQGVLAGGYISGVESATAMVIGLGRIGRHASKVFLMNDLDLVLVDKHPSTVEERMQNIMPDLKLGDYNVRIIEFDESRPDESVKKIDDIIEHVDILINSAVRRASLPKEELEYIVNRQMVRKMKPNSVISDATACIRDLIETAVPSEELFYTYKDEGVIHYNCDHIPSLVAQSATELLTRNTFKYVKLLLDGVENAITQHSSLKNAVMCYKGHLTDENSCRKKGLEYTPIDELL